MKQKFEIRFFGLKRSGNHPIINWITANAPQKCLFLNNIQGPDPYASNYDRSLLDNCTNFWSRSREENRQMYKYCLIYSYEDFPTEAIISDTLVPNCSKVIGESGKQIDILLLRDPFNIMASRYKASKDSTRSTVRMTCDKSVIELWKTYAKKFIDHLPMETYLIVINFNEWFKAKKYRGATFKSIFGLNVVYRDLAVNKIPEIGAGSSFDKHHFDGKAQEMKIFERWKEFKDDETFKSFFDSEIFELSEKIFGKIEGTEVLK